ncbi:MAG TPA: hypothetical protein EYP05_01685 [Piscirickettsiaceae bacterium]|nr:hypothetical protein [Piscirickettsiaceae bacterium]
MLLTHVSQAQTYNPQDTFYKVRTLAGLVLMLQQKHQKPLQLPPVQVEGDKHPRHEYQKALEVLSKINRYRQINQLGPVAVPPYPSRQVTANEVYEMIQRLITELRVLMDEDAFKQAQKMAEKYVPIPAYFSRTHNYELLWRISKAFDPLLGVRGFTPSDVYGQTLIVLDAIRFLRTTQNITDMPPKPPRPDNKHPNHALQEAARLLQKIHQAERNLWMDAVEVPRIPKRVITPTEVYDQMQTIIAELQRIKYRLGVERDLIEPPTHTHKTPSDVVQNLRWAQAAMPLFPLDKPLIQYDPQSLLKTPSDVYAIAENILHKLHAYKRFRGIRLRAQKAPYIGGLQPRHVYQKTTEVLSKVVSLRQQVGLGASALPLYPMRPVTPSDVYQTMARLERELDLIYKRSGMDIKDFTPKTYSDKVPSDVFHVVWTISYEMDTILGTQGQTPSDVYRMAVYLEHHAQQLAHKLGYDIEVTPPPFKPGLRPADVIVKATELFYLIGDMKKRAGIFTAPPPIPPANDPVTPTDVYNLVVVIAPELIELEVHHGIREQVLYPAPFKDKTPSHVYQKLETVRRLLHQVRYGGKDD